MKILNWIKQSNRWKHLTYGFLVSLVAGVTFTCGAAAGMEFKEFKELEKCRPASTFDNWTERAEDALAKMKETHRKVKQEWAHACLDGDKVKVKKGSHGLLLLDMSVLEARLLASERDFMYNQ